MTTSVKAVGFTLDQKQSDMVDSKLKRIAYADDLIVDLLLNIKHEKAYVADKKVNFRWGTSTHVSGEDFDFGAALNKMMDVLDNKIKKEKDKIQDHQK
ncbi:HPF/RaiA family ribosome-associated protein [uncultured Treponema sp.]|uniref:HPF/RaiA family ribosome-associated protein n=1 Tax=uncultured Treponema sp. TaxID=162155 RepID=UPI0025961CB2|nr:HPF/RaiA family ribosome-associated protein [uncultured Treponema sp.]